MAIKKGLGRGLDMLIPQDHKMYDDNSSEINDNENHVINKDNTEENIISIDINKIEPNRNQPRQQFDEDAIEELAESIKQYGILQPIIVKKRSDYFEIITGERRWRASKKAGLKEIPVIIKDYDDNEIIKVSLIENLQRENLNPIEEAQAYLKLQEEYGLKQDEIAVSVSKSRTAITNTMRLLKLDERVQKMIMDNLISSGHGRTLIPIKDYEQQYEVACKILDENLSVREAENYVKKIITEKKQNNNVENVNKEDTDVNKMFEFYENKMKDIFGCKVNIKNKKNNKGKIEIEYYSKEELEKLIDLIQSIKS